MSRALSFCLVVDSLKSLFDARNVRLFWRRPRPGSADILDSVSGRNGRLQHSIEARSGGGCGPAKKKGRNWVPYLSTYWFVPDERQQSGSVVGEAGEASLYMDHHQSEQTFVSVIVPLLNEGPTLEALCRLMSSTLRAAGFRFEIIFVDDGNTDDSAKTLRALAKGDPCVRWLRMRANFGKSAALAAGILAARG